jgi:PKD repeat protein
VLAGHTYAQAGSFPLAVQVRDDGGASLAGTQTLTVADHALANLSILAPTATEGKSTNLITLATFADFIGAPATDFTALVHWGDGTTSTVSGPGIVAGSGGYFQVQAAHTYAEEGTYTLAVQVRDNGSVSLSASQAIAVADATLYPLGLFNPSATEGQSTGTFTVALFADRNPSALAADFTATVSWGDGSSSAASVVGTGAGTFAVLAAHTYAEEGNATLAVQISDDGGASLSVSRAIAVADAALTGLGLQNPHAIEGLSTGTVTVATFTDTNAAALATDFTAAISWGDGSSSTVSGGGGVVALGGGVFAVEAAHTYAQAGNYALSVQVLDTGGATISGSRGVAVATPTLTNLVLSNLQPTEAKGIGLIRVASFHDSNPAVPVTDFTATISWGGGTTTLSGAAGNILALGNGNFALLANHTYAEEGSYSLSVQVSDTGGDSLSGSRAVGVADARLSDLGVFNFHATEGKGTGTFTVATFHDPNAAAPAADFTALVHWGDGGTSTVSGLDIVSEGNGLFAVLASHTYAEAGTYTLSVQVFDDGGASASASHTLTVAP